MHACYTRTAVLSTQQEACLFKGASSASTYYAEAMLALDHTVVGHSLHINVGRHCPVGTVVMDRRQAADS
jgi:hypothetical protein